jgi:hypothetical protein
VPVVLGLVYRVPPARRASLVFEYADPTLRTAVAAAFVHLDATHLLVNASTYLLVASVGFALSVASGHRGRFYAAFVTFVCCFPPVLAALNLAVPRSAVSFGFSGVVMAFAGYLSVALAECLDDRTEDVAPLLFFLTVALVALLSRRAAGPGDRTAFAAIALAAGLLAAPYAAVTYARSPPLRSRIERVAERPGEAELLAVGLATTFGVPFVAFPATPVVGDGVVNLYTHLLGYALGFVATFSTVMLASRLGASGR